jgi:hypothetical protein
MNPFLTNEMAQQHIRDLQRDARATRVPDDYRELDRVTVRAFESADRDAVRVLAALEGVHLPTGPVLVAEVDELVLAALPLDGGRPLADPFRPTSHLVALLRLRAEQLRAPRAKRRRGLSLRLRGIARPA